MPLSWVERVKDSLSLCHSGVLDIADLGRGCARRAPAMPLFKVADPKRALDGPVAAAPLLLR
jgi:hypothetical protein